MAASADKILRRLAAANDEFTRRQFNAFFLRSGYGPEKQSKWWNYFKNNEIIVPALDEEGKGKITEKYEPIFQSTMQ